MKATPVNICRDFAGILCLYFKMCFYYSGTPCLSFDIIPDNLGASRDTFPHTCYLVAGTQASKKNQNNIIVMKVSNVSPTYLMTEFE